jgi:hypothetical protein
MSEDEIQRQFDSGIAPGSNDADTIAYKEVFRVLEKEPRIKISGDFASRVLQKIVARQQREARRDMIWLTFGVTFLVIGLIVTAVVAGLRFQFGLPKEMYGIIVFSAAVIVIFNWIEKKTLVKRADQ